MTFGRPLVWVNCGLFALFGLGFALVPDDLAILITGAAPATASAVTDMRATYGGMALGLGCIFGVCARRPDYVRVGVQGVLVVMAALAAARVLGIMVDGAPNAFMLVFLGAEIAMAGLAAAALR